MDDRKRNMKGSVTRDEFKQWHKTLSPKFYASDLDLVLIGKNPPGIVAALDYKMPNDHVTFSEAILYNQLLTWGVPVFLIYSIPPFDSITIMEYLGANWKPEPPIIETVDILLDISPQEFEVWERELRRAYG